MMIGMGLSPCLKPIGGGAPAGFSPPAAANLKVWCKSGELVYTDASALFTAASQQYLSIADQAALRGNQDFSFAGWVYCIDSGGGTYTVISKDDSTASAREYLFQIEPGGNFQAYLFNSSLLVNATVAVTYSAWNFFAITYNAATKTISISVNNGVPGTATHGGTANAGNSQFRIGAAAFGGGAGVNHYNGAIDAVGRWNKVLSPSEITQLYNSGAGLGYSQLSGSLLTSLISFWELNEASGTRVDTFSGYNLTPTNGPGSTTGIVKTLAANNDPISQWRDQSGNNNHLIQPTLANRPTYKTNIKNGYPASRGDGVDDYLNCGASFTESTVIAVVRDYNDTFPPRFFGQGQVWSCFMDGATNNCPGVYQTTSSITYLTGVDTTTTWSLMIIPMSASNNYQARINGANRGSTILMAGAPTSQFGIHNNGNTGAPLECGNNDFLEVAVYNSIISGAQMQEWEAYLNAKFAVY